MSKILLERRDCGGVFDSQGLYLGGAGLLISGFNLEETSAKKEKNLSIQDIIKLKEAGFSSEEITDLHNKEVI